LIELRNCYEEMSEEIIPRKVNKRRVDLIFI
jgi:hypothetical protein